MPTARREPWIVRLVDLLLAGGRVTISLFACNPFPGGTPRCVRAELHRYAFTRPGDGAPGFWRRERLGSHLPPLERDEASLRASQDAHGFRQHAMSTDQSAQQRNPVE
jgi:hypothetical protein